MNALAPAILLTPDTLNEETFYVELGRRIRRRRRLLGLTQERLGEGVGTTFQQIQKYECGANQINLQKFVALCLTLEIPPRYFLEFLGGMGSQKFFEFSPVEQNIYKHLGGEIRAVRKEFNDTSKRDIKFMSQQALGASTGVRFQQIQKYEAGQNRISLYKLWVMAHNGFGLSNGQFAEALTVIASGQPLIGTIFEREQLVRGRKVIAHYGLKPRILA